MPTPRIHKESTDQMYFMTLTVIDWIDIFTKKEYFDLLVNTLRFCQKNKGLFIHGFVMMTNHIHLIVSIKEGFELSEATSSFKKYTTKEIKRLLLLDSRKYILHLIKNSISKKKGSTFQVWKRENYPETIETEKFFYQKLEYIHNNPVRKGYVEKAEDWLYSSARNYLCGGNSIIKIDELY